MEMTISKFAEVSNVVVDTPSYIVGRNGAGKTTCYQAYLWCLTGKGKDGQEMGEAVYSTADADDKRIADVSVSFDCGDATKTFQRICAPIYQRRKGSDEKTLKTLCATTYIIDGVEVTKANYEAEVSKLCMGRQFQLFSDIDYFANLQKDKQLSIFMELLKVNRDDYFAGLKDLKSLKSQLADIDQTTKNHEAYKRQEEANLRIIEVGNDNSKTIKDLKKQITDLQEQRPTLSKEEVEENNANLRKISELEQKLKEGFVPQHSAKNAYDEANKAYFGKLDDRNELVRRKMAEEKALEQSKDNLAELEENCEFDENKGEFAKISARVDNLLIEKEKVAKIVERYDEMIKEARCTLCVHCEDIFCENKVTNLKEKSQYIAEIEQISNEIAELKSKSYQLKEDWEIEMNEKITYWKDAIERNKKNLGDFDKKIGEIDKQMAEMVESSAELEEAMKREVSENHRTKMDFDAEIAKIKENIADLRKKMHTPKVSEVNDKLYDLKTKLSELEARQSEYERKMGAKTQITLNLEENQKKLDDLVYQRIAIEKEVIAYEDADRKYREDVQRKANEMMPKGMSISLFRPLISGEGYEQVFEIQYDSKKYKNTALKIWGNYMVTNMLQEGFSVDLPIFIDDVANIVNDDLLEDILADRKTIVLVASKIDLEIIKR